MTLYIIFIAVMSAAAFAAYGADKRKAIRHKKRLDESLLLGLSVMGGAAGALAAMRVFRHKTRKSYFWIINIACLVFYCCLFTYLLIV